jgi:hypothetical protein
MRRQCLTRSLVFDLVLDVHRRDFIVEQASCLEPELCYWLSRGIGILGFWPLTLATRDDLSRLARKLLIDTRHILPAGSSLNRFTCSYFSKVMVIRLNAACHDPHRATTDATWFGGNRDGLKAN